MDIWGYTLVAYLDIIFKSVHRFRCYGNVHVGIHRKGVAAEREMLASARTRSMAGIKNYKMAGIETAIKFHGTYSTPSSDSDLNIMTT